MKNLKPGDHVRVIHAFGEGSYSSWAVVISSDGKQAVVHEYAYEAWYWDDEDNIGGCWNVPTDKVATFPTDEMVKLDDYYLRDEPFKENGSTPTDGIYSPSTREVAIFWSGSDKKHQQWTNAAVARAAEAFGLRLEHTEDGGCIAWAKETNIGAPK